MRKVSPASTSAVKHLWVHFDDRKAEPCIMRTAATVTPITPANDLKYFFIVSSLRLCVICRLLAKKAFYGGDVRSRHVLAVDPEGRGCPDPQLCPQVHVLP